MDRKMSLKVYAVHHGDSYLEPEYQWESDINRIKELLPDKIICLCLEEQDAFYIFRNFFKNIENWLDQQNRYIDLIVPSNANYPWHPRIRIHTSPACFAMVALSAPHMHAVRNQKVLLSQPSIFLNDNQIPYTKIFSCYNNNVSFHKSFMIDNLVRYGLIDHGIVTAHLLNQVVCPDGTPYKWQWHDGSKLLDEDDFKLNSNEAMSADRLPKSYNLAAMDIVTESRYANGEFFFSEKTMKPIAALKPFLVCSCKGYHKKYLRDYFGFQLYDEIFDYAFDDEPNIEKRIDGLLQNVQTFKTLFETKGESGIYSLLNEKLWYNYTQVFRRFYDKHFMIPEVLNFMSENDNWYMYGNGQKDILLQIMIKNGWCVNNIERI
jgi:hypothetical protein